MKKLLPTILLFCSILLLSGCNKTNNSYNTVDDFEKAMLTIKNNKNFNSGYILEGVSATDNNKHIAKFSNYFSNDKFKWIENISVNGKDFVILHNKETYLIGATKYKKYNTGHIPSSASLLAWPELYMNTKFLEKKFVNKSYKINGMNCTMISYIEPDNIKYDFCVSKEFGIPIYLKTTTKTDLTEIVNTIELSKVQLSNLSDSEFKIPYGMIEQK